MYLGKKKVFVQQDNASPHCLLTDKVVKAEGEKDGWEISLVSQPANSPDLNVLDLGFFSSLQALQQKKEMRSIDDVIAAVKEAFEEVDRMTFDNTFGTLMSVMEQILLAKGGNKISIPHVKKKQRRKNGESLASLECSELAFQIGYNALHNEMVV